jgi:hypothetical protein
MFCGKNFGVFPNKMLFFGRLFIQDGKPAVCQRDDLVQIKKSAAFSRLIFTLQPSYQPSHFHTFRR